LNQQCFFFLISYSQKIRSRRQYYCTVLQYHYYPPVPSATLLPLCLAPSFPSVSLLLTCSFSVCGASVVTISVSEATSLRGSSKRWSVVPSSGTHYCCCCARMLLCFDTRHLRSHQLSLPCCICHNCVCDLPTITTATAITTTTVNTTATAGSRHNIHATTTCTGGQYSTSRSASGPLVSASHTQQHTSSSGNNNGGKTYVINSSSSSTAPFSRENRCCSCMCKCLFQGNER